MVSSQSWESSEDPNDISSGEDAWPDPVTEEVEEEEEVKFPLPTMGVPPLEENDEPYPDSLIGEMDINAVYTDTMVPGVDEDNVPPPVGVRVVMENTPFLYDQNSHKSETIWHGEDPGCLECTEHFQTLRHWPMDERMLPNIEVVGFGALYRVQWMRLDKPLITSLVERWSETNTFHLANGEMTITLEDVVVLLGLRVDGFAVTGSTQGDWMELARVLLGVKLPPDSFQGGRLSLAWIGDRFLFCPDDVPDEVKQQHARAFLLHLVGLTIFLNGSARGVHMAYLTQFEDFDTTGRYSWGELRLPSSTGNSRRRVALEWSTFLDLWAWERLHIGRLTLLKERALQDDPLGSKYTNATNPCGNLVLYRTELNHQRNYQVTPAEDVEHVTRISRKGRAGEDWATNHRDYIARWEARAESVVTGSRAHTPRHAPSEYMTWYLSVTRRFVSPPPTEPAMLGRVRNVVERVDCREAMDPSSADPYLMEIGHYCQSVLHNLPLLEGTIVGGEMSHAGEPSHVVEPTKDRAPRGRRARRRPTSETTKTTTRVEDPDEVPVVAEPMVPDLSPG
ncbi:hypothetical protein H6P81_003798 [Aristolochia fimbriata]|uniref:Aminotransferase-like plant mobile domain-containing protein n=1 Tax=Aristolochia fimbriata TaxID=158543 RepID=A0AAV7FDM3_ARIFI|nr:hypothetical protein H6P81_003798 [Aristolochia fimbriata]